MFGINKVSGGAPCDYYHKRVRRRYARRPLSRHHLAQDTAHRGTTDYDRSHLPCGDPGEALRMLSPGRDPLDMM
jgi:hypothetical protein